ncbi:MAG: cellulase family glycosylhydrolase [Actinomycetota bacterium]|nr:cellulase family glycosylhydrolase [Actinomycetota bacterium]
MTTGRSRLVRLLAMVLIGVSAVACQASPPHVEIGMTVHLRGADAANLKKQFDLMADMKVSWVRMDVDWSAVESGRGQFDWSYPDRISSEASAHGMKVLAVVAFSPAWARPSATGPSATISHARPDQLSDFTDFARAAVQRYASQGVHSWEVWNEPNSGKFWPPRPDADEYGRMFREAAAAIHGVDSGATVLIGGLAPRYDGPDAGISPADYLERLYANGSAQVADGIAVHPYSFPALPADASQPNIVGGFQDLPALHGVTSKHGDGGKKIWITEFGAPTGTGPNAVSEQDQAKALLQARHEAGSWDWAGPLIYYELVDGGTNLTEIEDNFGVLRADLSLKPAATALMNGDAT